MAMGKYIRIEDLSPDQLRAQVRLCFKFMEQCLSILNGEDVPDNAAIRLVDPIGDSSDMELFYKCKQIGGAGDLSDAAETIATQQKQIAKLKKRLAKKHDEIESLKQAVTYEVKFDTSEFKDKLGIISTNLKDFFDKCSDVKFDTPLGGLFHKAIEEFIKTMPSAISNAVADKCVSVHKRECSQRISEDAATRLCDAFRKISDAVCKFRVDSQKTRSFFDRVDLSMVYPKTISFSSESIGGGNNFFNRFHICNLSNDDCEELVNFCKELQKERDFKLKWGGCKFKKGQKVFYMEYSTCVSSKIDDVSVLKNNVIYTLTNGENVAEPSLYANVEDLIEGIKKNIRNGE